MKRKFRLILTNPITLFLPIMVALVVGWQQYALSGLSLSVPEVDSNLLNNGDFTAINGDGVPAAWRVGGHGDITYDTSLSSGLVSGHTFALHITRYKDGDLTFTSPRTSLSPHQTYLYKGYYTSNTTFSFLVRYYYRNGSSELKYLRDYEDGTGTWSTVSDAFDTDGDISAVQYVYKMSSLGRLSLNGMYLEPDRDVYIPPGITGRNIIPNSRLTPAAHVDMPDKWSPYSAGTNTAAFAYSQGSLQVSVSNFKNGEAKWQYEPLRIQGHQLFQYRAAYQSNAPVRILAEYGMGNGSRQFETIAVLRPADEWTTFSYQLETPPLATSMLIGAVLNSNGTLATKDYSLINITKTGAAHWKRPLISLTFDDDWTSISTNAEPVLAHHGFRATFYVNPTSIETNGFLTAAQLDALAKSGNEIAAHGYEHDDMTSISQTELNRQLQLGRDYLRKAGYAVSDFATPYGNSDAEVQWYARRYFQTMRSTDDGRNTRQDFDPYDLKVLYIESDTKLSTVADAIQDAKLYDSWLIFVYHRVGVTITPVTAKVENTTLSSSAFVQQMNLVRQSGITVLPVAESYTEVSQQ